MRKNNIKIINKTYLVFLIFVIILMIVLSFITGNQMYYLINTNLKDTNNPVKSKIANWRFEVFIEY